MKPIPDVKKKTSKTELSIMLALYVLVIILFAYSMFSGFVYDPENYAKEESYLMEYDGTRTNYELPEKPLRALK